MYIEKTFSAFLEALEKQPSARPAGPHVVGHAGKPAGQRSWIRAPLIVRDRTISSASFQTQVCPACIACASSVRKMARGLSVQDARGVEQAALAARVGELPRAKRHRLVGGPVASAPEESGCWAGSDAP